MTKKRSSSKKFEVDRFGSIPDCLVHHILSFLDMKDVFLTGILSRRWRDLSTSVPNLQFHSSFKYPVKDHFIRFVDRALMVNSAPRIQKFCICFPYREKYASNVDEWIGFAVRKGVQELELDFSETVYNDDLYVLPSCLLNCETLVSLTVKTCSFGVFDFNKSFSKLTALSLTCEYIEQVLIDDLLKGFPLLEELEITSYCHAVEIRSSSSSSSLQLKRLTIDACHVLSAVIDVPNLQTLNICTGSFGMFSFKDMAFLREACIDVSYPLLLDGDCISSLEVSLQNLCHAEVLKLSSHCVQVMPIPTFEDLDSYFKTKCLILKTGVQKYEMPGIANLLWSSPDLENLIIDLVPTDCIYDEKCMVKYNFDERYYWESLKASFPCLIHRLKTIKITGFMGPSGLDPTSTSIEGLKEQIQLMKFLLKNSMVLEEMSIHISRRPKCINEKKWLEIILEVTRCLVAIPRQSPHAMVIFYNE